MRIYPIGLLLISCIAERESLGLNLQTSLGGMNSTVITVPTLTTELFYVTACMASKKKQTNTTLRPLTEKN